MSTTPANGDGEGFHVVVADDGRLPASESARLGLDSGMILGAEFGSLEALVERLLARVRELESTVMQQKRVIAEQADRIVELDVEAPPPPRSPSTSWCHCVGAGVGM